MDVSAWIRPGIGTMVERMLLEIPGLRVDMSDLLPEIDGVVDQFVPPRPRPTRAVLTAPARLARAHPPIHAGRVGPRSALPPVPPGDPGARLARPDHVDLVRSDARPRAQALATADLITDLRVDYLPRSGYDLLRLHAMLAVLGLRSRSARLTAGARTRTEDANRALAVLPPRSATTRH